MRCAPRSAPTPRGWPRCGPTLRARAEIEARAAALAATDDPAARTAIYDVLWDRIIDAADNLAYRLALNTLVAGQHVLSFDASTVGAEIADGPAVRALARAIAGADPDRAHAAARELLERSVPESDVMTEILYYAFPYFILLLIVEYLSFRHLEADGLVGYDLKDSRTSITMGIGNVIINVGWKFAVLALYAVLYELAPWHLPADAWWVWVALFFADDFSYYWFHRVSHESRVFWASHVVHHSSQHYNLSTALRQTWVPMTYAPFWLWMPLVGFAPWMVLLAQAWSLIYQFGIHTERIGRLPRPIEAVLQHAVAPPRPSRLQRAVPGQELRRDPRDLGPAVRDAWSPRASASATG